MNNKAEPGLRLPASVSALGRASHPAGRGPSLASLFPPLAAVASAAEIEKDRHTNVYRHIPRPNRSGSHQLLTFLKIGTRALSNSPLGWLLALLRRLRVALANFSAAPDRALKNWSAAPASPPCFRRWRRSALLLFKSRARLNKKASTRMCTCFFKSEQRDLNPRPPRPERGALPTALCPENTATQWAAVWLGMRESNSHK